MSDEPKEGAVILCGVTPKGGVEVEGVPEKCPCCGGELEQHYGLAGGGCGVAYFCDGCDYYVKAQDRGDDLGPWIEFRPEPKP